MNCIGCGSEIPQARLDALPGTQTCIKCSTTKKFRGFNVVEHKTGNWVQIIKDENLYNELIDLDKDKGRGRTGYAGIQ